MCQPEEVKGWRRSRFVPLFDVRRGKPPELYQSRFLWMQLQFEPREALAQLILEALRILFVLESKHEVVTVTHDDDITPPIPSSPLLSPQVERVMQTDVS